MSCLVMATLNAALSSSRKRCDLPDAPVYFNAKNLQATKDAFVSQLQLCKGLKESLLKELFMDGFRVLEWDGRFCLIVSTLLFKSFQNSLPL